MLTPSDIRALRVRLGLDMAAFAARLGVSLRTAYRIEERGLPPRATLALRRAVDALAAEADRVASWKSVIQGVVKTTCEETHQ